ncbi:hypothetical protein [Deinococcus hopiensis]|uniref:Uncharacterized protein n=1 Tax=Deinococcus hopiensis KR-140 TaxID=695939 RepID=A0A1W1VKU9_9DEIO|nr:hypothetical protein [Deinococcus hopiensis]SMB93948.1 hypothetical protein SAMN00790413_02178 [Deinococcus hopiensis KR-140]
MRYKMLDYRNQSFMLMSAHEYDRWQDNLQRRFEDCGEAGNVHIHVRLNGEDRAYAHVDEYLEQFTVKDVAEDEARVLIRLFAADGDANHAWYGPHEIFQPRAGK